MAAKERERQEEANTNRDSEEIISMIGESDGGLDIYIYIYTAAPSITDKLHSTLSLEKYFRELISISKHFLES